jgi:hypothetical protein
MELMVPNVALVGHQLGLSGARIIGIVGDGALR